MSAMSKRIFSLVLSGWLVLVVFFAGRGTAFGGEGEQGGDLQGLLQGLLNDEQGELGQMLKQTLGKDGGNRFFYFPTPTSRNTPEQFGVVAEDVFFKSADGTKLHGWFLPVMQEGRKLSQEEVKGTVVFSHGNAGAVGDHLGFVTWLVKAGYQVFMYDYRAYGKSEGRVSREGLIRDVQAAFDYVVTRPDVDGGRLISFAHSLGGAKSIAALADKKPAGLRAVIVDGTFASYQGMARHIGGEMGAQIVSEEWAAQDSVAKLAPTPLLVIHGTDDRVVPFAQGEALFQKGGVNKTLLKIPGGGHQDSLSKNKGEHRVTVLAWLEKVLGEG